MIKMGLCYDDVLLEPKYSTISSRSTIDLSVEISGLKLKHPIIPANMKTVTGERMIEFIIESGGLGILHRFMSIEDQLDISNRVIKRYGADNFSVSVGVNEYDDIGKFLGLGVRNFCIDIAHGDSSHCINMIKHIKKEDEKAVVIAGNVATGEGAKRLWLAGADIVKVGVGPGSLCTTRIETGNGVPQLTALMEVHKVKEELSKKYVLWGKNYGFIADGGIRYAGDIVKALCFADMVMVGNLFAGTDESPGEIIDINGKSYKSYAGSSTHKTNHVEGVAAMVSYKGRANHILTKLLEGVKSGCSYQGVDNLLGLRNDPQFIGITNAGLRESHPHDVIL